MQVYEEGYKRKRKKIYSIKDWSVAYYL
jgi:hypothetical protein